MNVRQIQIMMTKDIIRTLQPAFTSQSYSTTRVAGFARNFPRALVARLRGKDFRVFCTVPAGTGPLLKIIAAPTVSVVVKPSCAKTETLSLDPARDGRGAALRSRDFASREPNGHLCSGG
jgi:hypothetical protein